MDGQTSEGLKRGTEVEVTFRGKMVSRPREGFGARVTVQTEHGTFWAVVPVESVRRLDSEEQAGE